MSSDVFLRLALTILSVALMWIGIGALLQGKITFNYRGNFLLARLFYLPTKVTRRGRLARLYALIPIAMGALGLYRAWFYGG